VGGIYFLYINAFLIFPCRLLVTGLLSFLSVTVAGHTWHTGRTCPTVTPFPNLSIDKVWDNLMSNISNQLQIGRSMK